MDQKEERSADTALLKREDGGKDPKEKLDDDFAVEEVGLKRQIGLVGTIAFLIGAIIGSGIFATPTIVAMYAGN